MLALAAIIVGLAVLWEHSSAASLVTGGTSTSQAVRAARIKQIIQRREQLGLPPPTVRTHGFEMSHLRALVHALVIEAVVAAAVVGLDLLRRANRRRSSSRI